MDEKLHRCAQWAKQLIRQPVLSGETWSRNPKMLTYAAILSCIIIWLSIRSVQYLRTRRSAMILPQTPQLEKSSSKFKAPARKPGGISMSFKA